MVILLISLVSIFKPSFISNSSFFYIFEAQNLNTILLLASIVLTSSLFFYQDNMQTNGTFMEFQSSATIFSPGIDCYVRISPSVYQLIQSNDSTFTPSYYCIQVIQEQAARYPLLIPIEATIIGSIGGTNIKLSNLKIGWLGEDGKINTPSLSYSLPRIFLNIEKMYQPGSKIYLCFSFFLGESTYSFLRNKIIVIKFDEYFTNIYGKRIKKTVLLKIYNSEYGLQFQGQS